jgi:hypothetical protein
MKVVCIDAYTFTGLTYGKVYDEVKLDDSYPLGFITIIDNNNDERSYLRSSFITLEEFREKKLKEIGL